MRKLLTILTLTTIGCQSGVRTIPLEFETIIYNLDNPQDSVNFIMWKKSNLGDLVQKEIDTLYAQDSIPVGKLYYSDDDFSVFGYCLGKFGGPLMFQDMENKDSIYYMECACPVMIEKRKEGYYITESLAHIMGFAKIQFLQSPKELIYIHRDSLKTEWKSQKYPDIDYIELWDRLNIQGKILIDTMGITFSVFFEHNNDNYLIFSDYQNTYLGLLTTAGLRTLDTLLNISTYGHPNDEIIDINNGYYHYDFRQSISELINNEIHQTISSGNIFVKGNSIVIAYKYEERIKSEQ
ncbi:MAG: hypothetical protein JJU02_11120 [Cryomorphaceae bacterium]|nr:hypothetical protein [Cryomorphaceae bacterium]